MTSPSSSLSSSNVATSSFSSSLQPLDSKQVHVDRMFHKIQRLVRSERERIKRNPIEWPQIPRGKKDYVTPIRTLTAFEEDRSYWLMVCTPDYLYQGRYDGMVSERPHWMLQLKNVSRIQKIIPTAKTVTFLCMQCAMPAATHIPK